MDVRKLVILSVLVMLASGSTGFAQGIYLTGVGPVNRGMGGAGTAAPLDSIGTLAWNSAAISAVQNEVGFGVEMLAADVDLSSTAGPGTDGKAGVAAVPSIGWVHHVDGTPYTIGLGLFGVGGFKNIQPAGNAILGGNPAYAAAELLQMTPTLSVALTDRLSVGFAPTVTIATVGFDPLGPSVISPFPSTGQGNRSHFGMGFQTGIYYITETDWHLGLSYRSTQWMEEFDFFAPPASVPGGVATFNLDLPRILSLGTAYTGCEGWTFAADFRYIGYDDADGFSELGWSDVFAAAFGVQKRVTDRLYLRGGVNFNEQAIGSEDVAQNILSPLIQSYNITTGASWYLTEQVSLNMAYAYLGLNELSGEVPTPGGPVTVTSHVQAHSGIVGITVKY